MRKMPKNSERFHPCVKPVAMLTVLLAAAVAACSSSAADGELANEAEALKPRPPVAVDLAGNNRQAFSPPDRPKPTGGPAKAFFDAFAADDYDAIPGLIQGFEAELAKPASTEPASNNAWLPLTAGLTYLWQSAEALRDPTFTPERAQTNIAKAQAALAQASARNPRDTRTDSFTGAIDINIGRALLNVPVPDVQAQGRALFAEGNRILNGAYNQWPEFHGFTYSFVRASAPAPTAQELDEAVAGTVKGMQYCYGSEVRYDDRTIELNVKPALARGSDSSGFRRACGNNWIAPHSVEGFFLMMGDVVARRGRVSDIEAARQLYRNATAVRSYATWGFKGMLQERIRTVEARVLAYKDADPSNHPFIGPRVSQCVVCHANSTVPRSGD
jgi:hypothetical protein